MKWLVGTSTLILILVPTLILILYGVNTRLNLFGDQSIRTRLIFADATNEANVVFRHHKLAKEMMPIGGGIIIFDYDGDDDQDIFVADSLGPNALYNNNGDGTFTEKAWTAGVAEPKIRSNGGCAADYDNDGDQDLYLTNYGPSRLFINNGDGTFNDVTTQAGVSDANRRVRSTGCAWGDYDKDGHLDFIVVRHLNTQGSTRFITRDFHLAIGGIAMFHNEGNGTFTNVTFLLGDTSDPVPRSENYGTVQTLVDVAKIHYPLGNIWGAGYQPVWTDLDNDGDLDIYVVNDFGGTIQPNVLWRNDGLSPDNNWSFVDASSGSNTDVSVYGMGIAIGDYDLNGYLDIFVTNIEDNVLLRNVGKGLKFTNTISDALPDISNIGREPRVTWGSVFFDYDNDGDEDLYIVSGHLGEGTTEIKNPEIQPNVLLRNDRDGTFSRIPSEGGGDDIGKGRSVVYFDFNRDGCLDLFLTNYGQRSRLLKNTCTSGNNWLVIKTIGTRSNRDGVGARITVTAGDSKQIREISHGGSQMSQNMSEAHFGLGTALVADSVVIQWPSGISQHLKNIAGNQRVEVTEPSEDSIP